MKQILVVMIAMLAAGCGYVMSGQWEDDESNWSKAFRSTKPPDVVVVHSLYWRNPHWSYEAGYLFEIEPNEALRKQLFAENQLRQVQPSEIKNHERPCFRPCPKWFAPKLNEAYEVWRYADDERSNFRVFIDLKTGQLFVGDFQV